MSTWCPCSRPWARTGPRWKSTALPDLYLAAGCSRGDPTALEIFEDRYLRRLRSRLSDIDGCPDRLDELKQVLRERLLVAPVGTPPRIASYSGRGALGAWVQIAARRLALVALRAKRPAESPCDEVLDAGRIVGTDLELAYVRLRYATEFRRAFEVSLRGLSSHERLLLRLHWVDGVSLTRIAAAYRVSQSTISRRLHRARDTVAARMKEQLEAILGITGSEFQSLLRVMESRFELSLARVLHADEAAAPEPPRGTGRVG